MAVDDTEIEIIPDDAIVQGGTVRKPDADGIKVVPEDATVDGGVVKEPGVKSHEGTKGEQAQSCASALVHKCVQLNTSSSREEQRNWQGQIESSLTRSGEIGHEIVLEALQALGNAAVGHMTDKFAWAKGGVLDAIRSGGDSMETLAEQYFRGLRLETFNVVSGATGGAQDLKAIWQARGLVMGSLMQQEKE